MCYAAERRTFAIVRRPQVEKLDLPMEGGYVWVYSLPYTADGFCRLREERKKKLLQRYVRHMEKSGVGCVYTVQSLERFLYGKFFLPDGRRIFSAFAGQIIERHLQQFSLLPEKTKVMVYENPFTENAVRAAAFMAMHTKRLCLVSPDRDSAIAGAAQLFETYGVNTEVTAREKVLNKADIALLLSAPEKEVLSSGLLLDFSGNYVYPARRDVRFRIAFGFVPFLQYFGKADCKSAAFMLHCYGVQTQDGVVEALEKIGWKICYDKKA